MSLMDSVSKLFGNSSSDSPVASIIQMLSEHPGGTGGLVQTFQQHGLGDVMSSWLGQGHNLPISSDQITRVFGNEKIAALAERFGISPEAASSRVSELLPTIVDKLSPNGTLPSGGDLMSHAASLFKGPLQKTA